MKEFIELTDTLAKIISNIETQRKKIGQFLREINSNEFTPGKELMENKILLPVRLTELNNMNIGGIDGGLVKKSFHGIDLMLIRTVGVIFSYMDNKLTSVQYYPSPIPTPEPKAIIDPFSDLEFEINSNIERQITEITTAISTVERYEPDMLLLNGSVIPHYTFVPDKSSLLYVNYQRMVDAYQKLFDTIREKKTILAGVIEDSRGTRFCEVISKLLSQTETNLQPEERLILNRSNDSNLLSYTLKHKERTVVFPYSSNPKANPILKSFPSVAEEIFTFYVKTAELDRPVRVDFFGDKGNIGVADRIAETLILLSSHSGYGMPSVLVEADQRAKLSEVDLESFYIDIINKTGNLSGLEELRRHLRPF